MQRMGCFMRSLAIGAGGVWLGILPATAQAPQQVISDTPEYCLHLLDRVSEMVRGAPFPPPQEVTFLSSEGQRMCDQGQTRGGIQRLRRALVLMMRQNAGP
jgi:hypothetical protein